jgi:hypothetical protein
VVGEKMAMDKKTVVGFVLIAMCLAFEIVAKHYGIDGVVDDTVKGGIAAGLLLIGAKQIFEYKKE